MSETASLLQRAVVVAVYDAGCWSDDFFSSTLTLEADGCCLHSVSWRDPVTGKPSCGEQVECFASKEWQQMVAAIRDLHRHDKSAHAVVDDIPLHEITLHSGEQSWAMQYGMGWQSDTERAKFRQIWLQIHRHSRWRQRLMIG